MAYVRESSHSLGCLTARWERLPDLPVDRRSLAPPTRPPASGNKHSQRRRSSSCASASALPGSPRRRARLPCPRTSIARRARSKKVGRHTVRLPPRMTGRHGEVRADPTSARQLACLACWSVREVRRVAGFFKKGAGREGGGRSSTRPSLPSLVQTCLCVRALTPPSARASHDLTSF